MSALLPVTVSTDELMNLVSHHTGTIIVMMTPELAAAAKQRLNHGNRLEKKKNVARLARAMRTGQWVNTGEPVVVSRTGVLNDGQHRLQAVIDSGVSVPMDIRFGAPREVFQQMGSGKRRSSCQTLTALGELYAPTQAAIAKLVLLHDAGRLGGRWPAVETPEIVQLVKTDRNILAVARAIRGVKRLAPMLSAGFGFPLVLAARVTPFERVFEFVDLVSTGLSADPDRCPARALHQRLVNSMSKKQRLSTMEIASVTGRAWNSWIQGHETKLRIQSVDQTGENFPKIVGPIGG